MKRKESGEGKGYAFVTFKTKEIASKAIEKLDNSKFHVSWYTRFFFVIFFDIYNLSH